jgi:hypothetical protein
VHIGCRFPFVTAYRSLDNITPIIDGIPRRFLLSLETKR